MKAKIKIYAMLMAITVGTLAASGQSANRGMSQREAQRKSSSSMTSSSQRGQSQERKVGTSNRQQADSRSTNQRTQVNRGSSSQRTAQPVYNSRNEHRQTASSGNRSVAVQKEHRKISTTNQHNPKSDYRKPVQSVNVGKTFIDPKPGKITGYSNHKDQNRHVDRNYSSSGHTHYYYPQKKVKIHVHPMTYHSHYRVMYYPAHRDIYWTNRMHRYYMDIYPGYSWRYPVGYGIQTISAFEAKFNIGEVSRVYGRVYASWFNKETDDLLLFFGGEYPNQEFTMIVPGNIARRFSWRPERYFLGQHVFATGLITTFDGRAEMVIKRKQQLDLY